MTALLRRPGLATLAMVATGLGCGNRALDPNHISGAGGVGTLTGAGGAVGDDGGSVDAPLPPDAIGVDFLGATFCGNGRLDFSEQCDDGNTRSGDGCSALCLIEDCFCGSCGTNQPCITVAVCGDGVLRPPEVCDDGNTMAGDGCAATCAAVETGWRCPVPGRRCVPICGDGRAVAPEECDDGNTTAGDGCSDSCIAEPTTARCGDGLVEGAEECDDGVLNTDTTYGVGCTMGCRYAASCGDGIVNGPEQCDLGREDNDAVYGVAAGCTPACTFPHFCGDAIIDAAQGEQCDFGAANGTIDSACTTSCKLLL